MNDLAFLAELNPAQYQAVTDVEGPQMIVAGAGSGKTRVLTYRLAFIISQGFADPQEMLALTFTNKAAKEMRERITKLVGQQAKSIQMGTFHSVFARLLRNDAEKLGYTRNFTIYDDDDQTSSVGAIIKELKYDDKVIKPRAVLNFISKAKTKLFTPEQCKSMITADDEFGQKALMVYKVYQDRLFKANAMDFDDLLMKPLELFEKFPEILVKYQNFFKFIMVDEYQDTNHAQYMITKLLAVKHENICVVGDDAQSIYAFRGANIQNILNFRKDFPKLKVYKLEQNYRSTKVIVEAANGVIKHNKNQLEKNVFTQNESGELILVMECESEQEEAKKVADKIRELKQTQNFFNKDFALLYRTNSQSRALEDALRRVGLKYKIFGGTSFYKRKEIKDIVAYLRISINPDDEQALKRIINYPTRGISDATVTNILGFAAKERISFWEAIKRSNEVGLIARAVNSVNQFVTLVESFHKIAAEHTAFSAVETIIKATSILKDLHTEGTPESLARWENVQELINSAKEYSEAIPAESDKLEAYLAEISLFTDAEDKDGETDYVTLMTIHSAKGLEFKTVFLVGLEDGLFPSFTSFETPQDLEEERRLFYVAITRAEKILLISYAKSRSRWGKTQYNEPSRFLHEIDSKFLQVSRSSKFGGTLGNRTTPLTNRPANISTPIPSADTFVASPVESLAAGQIVIHQKFGIGKILTIEGSAEQLKANVNFDKEGQRVLLLKYAKLQIIK